MPLVTYKDENERIYWRNRRHMLDKEFQGYIEDFEKVVGKEIIITWQDHEVKRIFRKAKVVRHYGLYIPTFAGTTEVQAIMLPYPEEPYPDDVVVSRCVIISYLIGHTGGYEKGLAKAREEKD